MKKYSELILKDIRIIQNEAVDYTPLLDAFVAIFKLIDFKYIKKLINRPNFWDNILTNKNSNLDTIINNYYNLIIEKLNIESLCIQILSNTRDLIDKNGIYIFEEKDNVLTSEALEWVNSEIRQYEKALIKSDKNNERFEYDNWIEFSKRDFDILLDEPLEAGYTFHNIISVFKEISNSIKNGVFFQKIDLDNLNINLSKSDIIKIVEFNFLSNDWSCYTLEKPIYKINNEFYCFEIIKYISFNYMLSSVIKLHRDKSVLIRYKNMDKKQDSDKGNLETEIRKLIYNIKNSNLIHWAIPSNSYPTKGIEIKLESQIQIDALFVFGNVLYIVEIKNIDKKFDIISKYNKIMYLYSGIYQSMNIQNQIMKNKNNFLNALCNKGIVLDKEFNTVKNILLCNHLIYSAFKPTNNCYILGQEDFKRFFADPLIKMLYKNYKKVIVYKDWWNYKIQPQENDFQLYLEGTKDHYVMEQYLVHKYEKLEIGSISFEVKLVNFENYKYEESNRTISQLIETINNDNKTGQRYYDINLEDYIDQEIEQRLSKNLEWFINCIDPRLVYSIHDM